MLFTFFLYTFCTCIIQELGLVQRGKRKRRLKWKWSLSIGHVSMINFVLLLEQPKGTAVNGNCLFLTKNKSRIGSYIIRQVMPLCSILFYFNHISLQVRNAKSCFREYINNKSWATIIAGFLSPIIDRPIVLISQWSDSP